MTEFAQTSDFVSTINYLLDDVLGLDQENKLVEVTAARSVGDGGDLIIELRLSLGPTSRSIVDLLSFVVDTDRLKSDHTYAIELQKEIREQLEELVTAFIAERTEGISGPERGIAMAAAPALRDLLLNEIVKPVSLLLSESILALELPERTEIAAILGSTFDKLRGEYFDKFVPEIAKTYAKLGLAEILTIVTSDSSPEWAQAIHSVGEGVFHPVIDTLVTNYFAGVPLGSVDVFQNVQFGTVFGNAMAGLLVDFEAFDREILDDLLGLDGENKIETWAADLLSGRLEAFVKGQFVDAIDFLGGDFDAFSIETLFADFANLFNIEEILGSFFQNIGGQDLAELFVDIDSLPEALLSKLGSTIGSGALGEAIGSIAMDVVADLFGQATVNVIGGAIFKGLGTLLGAGIGAIAGSVVFELLDDLFDGAISDIFDEIIEWIRNDSPQAFYQTIFDPATNEFHWSGYAYSKDGSDELRLAVRSTMEAFENKINTVIAFVGEPASFDPNYDLIMFAWGKKHFNESYASYIAPGENNKLSYNRSAEHVARETIGAVLSHMNFHNGHPITALAYDLWKAEVAATGGSSLAYYQTDALVSLQEIIGLARFANDYRQDPTTYDILMASDAPIGVTILQQYFEAEVRGFNGPATLEGRVLGFETIGSAAAGDTIVLNGPAWRAIARGGDDTIHVGAAAKQEINGGQGNDTVILSKDRSAYLAEIVNGGGYGVVLTDLASGIQITVVDVELFRFNGVTLSFDAAFPLGHLIPGTNGNDIISLTLAPPGQPTATVRDDTIYGADGDDIVRAGPGKDFVLGDGGNDRLEGEAGNDRLYGWTGNDVLLGGADQDLLSGEAGDDVLDGGADIDQLFGGPGNDIYIVDAGDVVTETANAGTDEVRTALAAYALGANVENLKGLSNAGQALTGNDLANQLTGGAGNDSLNGGPGTDRMAGGPGDDTYLVIDSTDAIVEAASEGSDRVYARVSYTLGAGVHVEILSTTSNTGTDPLVLTGNELDNRIIGNAGANSLYGMGGIDRLEGLAGNDRYFVDRWSDVVVEAAGQGYDTVFSSGHYTLAAGVEVEVLSALDRSGTNALDLTGNEYANGLYGNAGANRLSGGRGNDFLDGGAGDDRLDGGDGIDRASYASAGAAVTVSLALLGSAQNTGGGGVDTLIAIEELVGSPFADTLIGNASNNSLDGQGGADTMRGGGGDDLYFVDNVGDVVVELAGEGLDTVYTTLAAYSLLGTQIERLAAASDIAHEFRGSSGNNNITGGAGNDLLLLHDGGSDRALGGAGNDVLYFGGAFAAGDIADGGSGRDAIVLQGNVAIVFSDTNLVGIESLSLQSGANSKFGDTANNFYDFSITMANGNVAAGQQLIVNASSLRAGEDFTFDGSAESDGKFLVYGGHGVDILRGGSGNDIFFFEGQRWGPNDRVDGGAGRDALVIAGVGGLNQITFGADSFTSIESISLNNLLASDPSQKPSYQLVLNNGNVAAGGTLIVNGSSIPLGQVVNIDGRAVQDGNLILFGGGGHDVIRAGAGNDMLYGGGGQDSLGGGAGADIFRYDAVSDSPAGANDLIGDFQTGLDKIDLGRIDANTTVAGDQAFRWIGANAFSGAGAASAGELRVYSANGYQRVEGDTNGDGAADLVIVLQLGTAPLAQGDFLF